MVDFLRRHSLVLQVILISSIWVLTLIARLKFHGLVYGLDFGLYHPDGSLYSMQSLILSGKPEESANQIVNNFYFANASKHNEINASILYNKPNWADYRYRFLYPLLSVPFVKFLGMQGMLIIPALSLLIVLLLPLFLIRNKSLRLVATLFSPAILCSPTIVRWMFANTSDSLLVALIAIFAIVEYRNPSLRKWMIFVIPLVILSSFTRFCLILWLGIAFVFLLTRQKTKGLVIVFTSTLFALPAFLLNAGTSILPNQGNSSLVHKLFVFPSTLCKIIFYEFGQLFVLDKFLLLSLIGAILIAFQNFVAVSSKFLTVSLVSLFLTGSINGVIGVNFRYQLPVIVFMIWVYLDRLERLYSSKSQCPR